MAKYNVNLIKKLARKKGINLILNFFETSTQRIYDFDVVGSKVGYRRMKIVTFKDGNKLFPDTANVYIGSGKYGFRFNSYKEMIEKLHSFKWR